VLLELLIGTAAAAALVTMATVTVLPRLGRAAGLIGLLLTALGGMLGAGLTGDAAGRPLAAVLVGLAPALVLAAGRRGDWRGWARVQLTALAQASLVYLVYAALVTATTAHGVAGLVLGGVLWLVQLGSLVLTLSFAVELLDVLGRRRFPARDAALAAPEPDVWPGVCVQIPAYNEPPELLADTIRAVMRQDYPGRWMVQVVDNNTRDEAVWRPIEALCRELGERVEFMHLADWPGYKSGALNEATRRLPAWVEVIAVVDADYLVEPGFLRATARHFADPSVAFVQTPQHYRDWADDGYLAGLFYSYKYFFDVSMMSRAEHNAIIFGGTMGLVRRGALDRIGGWDEWCITEDAEASLRLLGLGYRGVYDPRSYGAGLMPLSFEGLKKQRFRWAFGGVQILKKHGRSLCGVTGAPPLGLTLRQRLAYLAGALQWFNEVLGALFTGLLLAASVTSALGGHIGLPALSGAALVVPPLLIVTGLLRSQWGLRRTAGCSHREAMRAHLVWFALSWVVARACVSALVRGAGTFLRTPKTRGAQAWQRAVRASAVESGLALGCIGGATALAVRHGGALTAMLAALLVMQAGLYASAPLCGLWAEGIQLTPARRLFAGSAQNTGERPVVRRAVLRLGVAAGLAAGAAVAASLAVAAPVSGTPFALSPVLGGPPLGSVAVPGDTVAHAATPAAPSSASASPAPRHRADGTTLPLTGGTTSLPTAGPNPGSPSGDPAPGATGANPSSSPTPSPSGVASPSPSPTAVGSSPSPAPVAPSPSPSPTGSGSVPKPHPTPASSPRKGKPTPTPTPG
jgi:cellulose synthase/poly-beta-1,6-N-acetylglucosamine synthase-like glycosyltransferase